MNPEMHNSTSRSEVNQTTDIYKYNIFPAIFREVSMGSR